MHDTCGQRYLIDCRANTQRKKKKKKEEKKKECGSSYCASCCWNISGILSNKRCKGEKVKKKNDSSCSPHCTLWWTLHKSHLCSAGGDLLLVKRKTKTNISWDRKPLMMKCSSHREQLSAGRHGRIMTSERETHSITRGERGGGLSQSHLAAITCKQTNALTRVHTWCTNACHITSNEEKNFKKSIKCWCFSGNPHLPLKKTRGNLVI